MASIKLAARNSPLSLAQVKEALVVLKPLFSEDTTFEINSCKTVGDKDLTTPLTDASIPDDYFTRELDQQVLSGEADLAVHSAKDLPEEIPEGIYVAALLPAADTRDAFVYRENHNPETDPIIEIGTSSPRRIEYIEKNFPEARCKSIRGNIGQRIEQLDKGDYDAVIIAACALDRLGLSHRINEYLDLESNPQQGRLAVTCRSEDKELIKKLRELDVRKTSGMVSFIGCPADASLLSKRAEAMLQHADLILYDRLIPQEVTSQIEHKGIFVGKTGHKKSVTQNDIHRKLLHETEKGQLVVRLQGGDPGILGHLGESLKFLKDWNIRCEVISTLTAAQVCASKAFAPLTHRFGGRSINILSGHCSGPYNHGGFPGPAHGNLAIYMGIKDRARIHEELLAAGWEATTPLIAGVKLGSDDECIYYRTLDDLPEIELKSPSTILLGSEAHPSDTALFTGSSPSSFLKHGPLLHLPMIHLEELPLDERMNIIGQGINSWDGIIFASCFAVQSFMSALLEKSDTRCLANKKILAVGPITRDELEKYGIRADASPKDFHGLASLALELDDSFNGTYFYPSSDKSPRKERVDALAEIGIQLQHEVFYHNKAKQYDSLPNTPFNRVIFTSGSTVKSYFDNFPDELKQNRRWLAVGPSTLAVLENLGLEAEIL